MHLVTLLDETTTAECRQEVAISLVKLFLGQGLVKELLDLLFELELAKPCKAGAGSRSGGFQPPPGAAKPPGPCVVIFGGCWLGFSQRPVLRVGIPWVHPRQLLG